MLRSIKKAYEIIKAQDNETSITSRLFLLISKKKRPHLSGLM